MRFWVKLAGGAVLLAAVSVGIPAEPGVGAGDPCAAPANEIVAENCKPGAPPGEWDIAGAGPGPARGFATDISVDQGGTVHFKIDSNEAYTLEIYRLGYYGGAGGRQVGSASATVQEQPSCVHDGDTGLIDCGNWAVSASWTVPPDAVSGIYVAIPKQGGTPISHIPFVVRDDDGGSDLLFQTSDTTWQAYNAYGGNSLYVGSPAGRAYGVSYNRPFTTASNAIEDFLFNAEYPMVRWLERNGYDVSYFTGVDSDRLGAELREHRTFLSVGHDEYWSGQQRRNVEAARDAGVSLAFFSGNEVFWKTRWEDGHRTLVAYKETHAGTKIDPLPNVWTCTWRDPRPFNPEGARPENALTGTWFSVNQGTRAIVVPEADGKLRFWRGTAVAHLAPGQTATLTDGPLGYEWDSAPDNGAAPAGLVRMSSTTASGVEVLKDHGSTYGPGTETHNLTLHRDTNGACRDALVFGAGTIQWSWGLDEVHERGTPPVSPEMQQATANLLADMGAQPATLQSELQPPTASTDTIPPTSTIDGPATRGVTKGSPETIHGTATDAGGGRVGAVEVSVDGGATWHAAEGREQWSFTWTPDESGDVTPLVRATDDSANLFGADQTARCETPGIGNPVAGAPSERGDPTVKPRRRKSVRRLRMSRAGIVRLRVSCPARGAECRVVVRLRRAGRTIARGKRTVKPGQTRAVKLRLDRAARRALIRKRSLRVTAETRIGGWVTRSPIRLLAPRGTR
jgi:Bacterial Ig domain